MGKRQDGRIEPGQKLSGAISARAWNRAQDAADIVLGERTGFGAQGKSVAHLPSLRATINGPRGYYGQAIALDSQSVAFASFDPATTVTAHAQSRVNTLGSFSTTEKSLVSFSYPQSVAQAASGPIAICCGNDSLIFAISGYAITRVRAFNYNHRYARLPRRFPGESSAQILESQGALDSCFFGPARIIGYSADVSLGGGVTAQRWRLPQVTGQSQNLAYPNYRMLWALVVI
jgi:hypothetical protein